MAPCLLHCLLACCLAGVVVGGRYALPDARLKDDFWGGEQSRRLSEVPLGPADPVFLSCA